jgi:hypothetical protein
VEGVVVSIEVPVTSFREPGVEGVGVPIDKPVISLWELEVEGVVVSMEVPGTCCADGLAFGGTVPGVTWLPPGRGVEAVGSIEAGAVEVEGVMVEEAEGPMLSEAGFSAANRICSSGEIITRPR